MMKAKDGRFETLLGLVRRYSPSGDETAAVKYLLQRMRDLGFTRAYADEAGNAIGVMGEGPRQIVLLGHIDTVPGEIPVRVEAGVLHGRGSVDAKAPLAAFVDAVAAVGAVEGWQFVVVGAVDEERESLGARHIVEKYRPDYAIIGEPSGWERITLGYKGSARARVRFVRAQAHTAAEDENAPEAAFAFWARLRAWTDDFNRGRGRVFEQVHLRLRECASGADGFATQAVLHIQARLPIAMPPADWYAQLVSLAGDAEVIPQGFAIPAWRGARKNALVRAFLGGVRAEGGQPGFVLKSGTADVNIVAPAWGCPAVVYGPGDATLDHTPQERLPLADYERAVGVLSHALRRITRSP